VSTLADWLGQAATVLSPFGTDSRLHWTGLSAFFVIGLMIYLLERKHGRLTSANPLRFLFPPELYLTRSTLVDIKVYIAGRLLKPLLAAIIVPLNAFLISITAALVSDQFSNGVSWTPSMGMVLTATILVAVMFDFGYYVTHRLSHETKLLWPFHKLHHSAEVLTPLTAKRNHPVFDLVLAIIRMVMIAPVAGAIFGAFGVIDFFTIFGLIVVIAVMNFTGGALRHSHIWLDFGPVLDRIFISPAQHQIHHSVAPEHHDKNYGLTLAIWDWMFGTLYIPRGREALSFGIADRDGKPQPQVHASLRQAYLVPFQEAAKVLRSQDTLTEKNA